MNYMQIFYWFSCFKDGHASVESDMHAGHSSLSINDEVTAKSACFGDNILKTNH
jgi:hypothetical protein